MQPDITQGVIRRGAMRTATAFATAALLVLTGAIGAKATDEVDSLALVESHGLLRAEAGPPVTTNGSNDGSARSSAFSVSTDDLLPLTPVDDGAVTQVAHLKASVIEEASYGIVTGIGASGTSASFIVLKDEAAPRAFDFVVGDGTLTLETTRDGSVLIHDASGEIVNFLLPPWAKDANGADLHTWYTIDGDVVTQHIDTAGAEYPIVADPTTGCGLGWCSIYFNRNETKQISAGGAVAATAITGACALAGPVGAAACGLATGAIVATAQAANSTNECVGLVGYSVAGIYNSWNPFIHGDEHCT